MELLGKTHANLSIYDILGIGDADLWKFKKKIMAKTEYGLKNYQKNIKMSE